MYVFCLDDLEATFAKIYVHQINTKGESQTELEMQSEDMFKHNLQNFMTSTAMLSSS